MIGVVLMDLGRDWRGGGGEGVEVADEEGGLGGWSRRQCEWGIVL